MEFNSQICTTEEQSKRLLALGLKKETADCCWSFNIGVYDESRRYTLVLGKCEYMHDIPAWSLHRLLCLTNPYLSINPFGNIEIGGEPFSDIYEGLISTIEFYIKGGHFSKEYLEERV